MNPRGGSRIVRRNRIRPNQALSVVAMLSVSFAAYALAQTRPMQPWRQSAESSIDIQERKDGLYVSTKNQHFSFVEKNSATGDPEWFALRETFTRTVNTDDNPVNHEVTVQAWAWSPSELKAQERWILHEEGDQGESGEIGSPFYKVTKYGCCGERTVYSYFAIDSGKRIYQSSSDLAEALVLNAYPLKERFVSYNDSTGNGKAFLTYGSRDHIISKIEIAGIGSIYETDTKLHFQYKGKRSIRLSSLTMLMQRLAKRRRSTLSSCFNTLADLKSIWRFTTIMWISLHHRCRGISQFQTLKSNRVDIHLTRRSNISDFLSAANS